MRGRANSWVDYYDHPLPKEEEMGREEELEEESEEFSDDSFKEDSDEGF